jgi:hypothetical protein
MLIPSSWRNSHPLFSKKKLLSISSAKLKKQNKIPSDLTIKKESEDVQMRSNESTTVLKKHVGNHMELKVHFFSIFD